MEVKEASYRQAEVDYRYKQSTLRDASLYADIDGYVLDNLYEEGEVVAAGYPVIVLRSNIQVINVGLTQDDIQKVQAGTKAVVLADRNLEKKATGEVTGIDQMPDMESRTYNVEITVTGVPDDYEFYLGSTCRVLLEIGKVKGTWIPLSSIQNDGQDFVYVVKDEHALRKNVKIIHTTDTRVRVEGLEPGEELVTAGMKNLSDGCLVEKGAD
jgi:RND family efflux transporter MFP subunit